VVIFASHDHEFVRTIANRIIEITPDGRAFIDRALPLDDYLEDAAIAAERQKLGLARLAL
jgi:ATPase subunit of ABC transporter with duplicated ATPase domains